MKKLALILITALAMMAAQSAYAAEDNIGLRFGVSVPANSMEQCAATCISLKQCQLAYFVTAGPKKGQCYVTVNPKPNANLKAKYGIYSKKAGRLLRRTDFPAVKPKVAVKSKSAPAKKPREKVFKEPRIGNFDIYVLNVCNKPGATRNCGGYAAAAFCKKKGYSDVLSYRKNSYRSWNTAHISNGEKCTGYKYDCFGFESITCYNPQID